MVYQLHSTGNRLRLSSISSRSVCKPRALPNIQTDSHNRTARMVNYNLKVDMNEGTLIIRPLMPEWLSKTSELLTEAFVDTNAARMDVYRRFLRREVTTYLEQHIAMLPRTVILTAVWRPLERIEGEGTEGVDNHNNDTTTKEKVLNHSSPKAQEMLLGTAEISFDPATRGKFLTLNSPDSSSYLSNMAVAPQHRRKGIAMHLIRAIEELCQEAGQSQIYLHLRLKDVNAGALYRRAGFLPVATDTPLLQLIGLDRRYLMLKDLSKVNNKTLDSNREAQ